jgi:hypothetical protein
MARPKSVKIGGLDYAIRYDGKFVGKRFVGHTGWDGLVMSIKPHLAEQVKRSTLLHEILHAAGVEDEELVLRLEANLFQIMCDNHDVVDWISGRS